MIKPIIFSLTLLFSLSSFAMDEMSASKCPDPSLDQQKRMESALKEIHESINFDQEDFFNKAVAIMHAAPNTPECPELLESMTLFYEEYTTVTNPLESVEQEDTKI
jgi:hypothetical protein